MTIMKWLGLSAILIIAALAHRAHATEADLYCYTGASQPFFQPASSSNPCPVSATVSASITAFTPSGNYANLTSTASSARHALPSGSPTQIVVYNTGTTAVSCVLGNSSVTAVADEDVIQPSGTVEYTVGSNTDLACINQAGDSADNVVVMSGGAGLFAGSGGGSGGSGGGTSSTDEASFTAGTTALTLGGGFYQTTATSNALTTGQGGSFQVTANRALFTNLRNSSGTEIGTSTTPVQVSVANTGSNSTAINVNPGTAGNWAIGATGSAVPSNAVFFGAQHGSDLVGLVADANSYLAVNVFGCSFGGPICTASGSLPVALNSTPSLANGNGVVPTQGGSVLSATNGGYQNLLQGNAVLGTTNGLYSNLLQGNAVLSTSNPIFVTGTGTAGTAATNPITVQGISGGVSLPVTVSAQADPCFASLKKYADFESTSSGGSIITAASSEKAYICAISIVTSAAANVSIIEGTGSSVCTGGTTAGDFLNTGTTAANGAAFAANGGIQAGQGTGTIFANATADQNTCVLFSTTNTPTVNVHVAYVQQ